MPTFGDFETIDEPIESREDSRHFTRVWQASRISVKDGLLYAVKCYIPRHGRVVEGAPKEDLEEHRSLEYIEGVKQIKKAAAEGQQFLTPIHEFGLTSSGDGAWYVTDFYGDATPILPRTLRSYITRGGKVDAPALRHTIYSIVQGCLALKRSRGCSHGNLKTTNVFRAGKPRALSKTPLVLGDAFPVAPLQLAQLDAQNKVEVGELLNSTMEVQDLQAIGELILQLVEVRLFTSQGDYDYPVIPSPAWNALGKSGEPLRQLCNRLLDPSLSLEKVNLEMIEQELRPSYVSTHAPQVAGAAILLCVVLGGGYFGWRYFQGAQADRRQKIYSQDMDEAKSALAASDADPTNILGALRLVEDALRRSPADPIATQLKSDAQQKRDSLFQKEFSQGTNGLAAQKFEESLAHLQTATILQSESADAKRFRDEAQTRLTASIQASQMEADYQTAMKNGRGYLAGGDFASASKQADEALRLKPGDADATQLRAGAQARQKARELAVQTEADYQTAMKNGRGYLASGDYPGAVKQADEALRIKPGDTDATQLGTDALARQKAKELANQTEADYQTAMKNGRGYLSSGDFANASKQAGEALRIKPGDTDATQLRADAQARQKAKELANQTEAGYQTAMKNARGYMSSGDFANASKQADEALRIKPGDTDATQLRTDALARQKARELANQTEAGYQTAMKNGRGYLSSGDYASAVKQAGEALRIKPGDTDATQLRADALARQKARELAVQTEAAYQSAMKNGRGYLSSGDYASAVKQSDEALQIKPGDTDAAQLRTDALARQKARESAVQTEAAYQTAIKNGRGYVSSGDYASAVKQADEALRLKPGDTDATQLRADALTRQKARELAVQTEADYQTAMKNGRGYLSSGDFANASKQADEALRIKPGDIDATQLRADAQAKQKAKELANQTEAGYQTAMKNGRGYVASGDYASAVKQADEALRIKPGDSDAAQLRADAQARQKARELAVQTETDYQTAMKNGRGYVTSGDYASAVKQADEALRLRPADTDATKLRADAQKKIDDLAQGGQKEIDYQTNMKAGHDSFAHGDFSGALSLSFKALELKPRDAEATKLRDDAQKKLRTASLAGLSEADYQNDMKTAREALLRGNYEAASAAATEALTLKPGDADAQQIIDKVQAKPAGTTSRPQGTNFAGLFGQAIPDLDFVWVDGLGPAGGGAYVAVNELSWKQYQTLGGTVKPLDPLFKPNGPADLDLGKAKAFVDSLNVKFAGKKATFRLPRLDEYKVLCGVSDFAAISDLVASDTSAGESFRKPGDLKPREIVAGLATNKFGLRNVLGNVREWTADGVPFGNSYAWGKTGLYSVTQSGLTSGEQIGLRLICEPKN